MAQLSGCSILQLIPSLDCGGAEQVCVGTVQVIVAARGKALVGSAGGVLKERVQQLGGKILPLPQLPSKNPLVVLDNSRKLAGLIREHRIDLIHVHSRAPGWSALVAARYLGLPFISTFHSAYRSRSALKKAYNSVMARGDRVIAVSQFIADHISRLYPKAVGRIRLVPPAVDLDYFAPESTAPARLEQLRTQFKLDPARPVVTVPGRLVRQKGQWLVIKALHLLQRPKVQCVLAGPSKPSEYRRLYSQAEQLGIQEQIRIPGLCCDMPALYLLSDAVVVPSATAEGFGLVATEALAMGRPVIASNLGALPEVVGQHGWLTVPDDPVQLAAILGYVLDLSPSERAAIAIKSRKHVESSYSLELMHRRIVAIYHQLW